MRDRLLARRLGSQKKSVLLLGPRQVGKSTLCRSLKPDLLINLADETEYFALVRDPAVLERRLEARPADKLICLDEVQRLPRLLNVVQMLLDRSRGYKFLLTGSSARKLRRGEVNLLPGRVVVEYLDPLNVLELGNDFDLDRALQIGMLPGIYLGDQEAAEVLGSYAQVYLREEVRSEALVRDLGGFARFLDVAALASGQWINYSKIASDIEMPKETIRRFFGLLEDTLLIFRLPPYQPRLKLSRRISQRDRFFLFDLGVRNALLGLHRRPLTADQRGNAFEQWFILQAMYLNRALKKDWWFSSYRTEAGAEVDLVIETEERLIGLEIKASRKVRPQDCRGLLSLEETVGKYKPFEKRIAYLGEHRQAFERKVLALPYLEALRELGQQ